MLKKDVKVLLILTLFLYNNEVISPSVQGTRRQIMKPDCDSCSISYLDLEKFLNWLTEAETTANVLQDATFKEGLLENPATVRHLLEQWQVSGISKLHMSQQFSPWLKGATHIVLPNLMLILSTYRVILHPSYLQWVCSFIIFIKERYSCTILSENRRESAPWAELKSHEHMSANCQQSQKFDAASLTASGSDSCPGSFLVGAAPSFSIQQYTKLALYWALLIKHSSPKHCSNKDGLAGKLNEVI